MLARFDRVRHCRLYHFRVEAIRSGSRPALHDRSHRPPGTDGEGYYQDDLIRLGHRRLAIIDATGGTQPMAGFSGRYQLVYNGEVYNHVELRCELKQRGVDFLTHSDTEVVLQCLITEGLSALGKFDGMFALAWWDALERRLLLARDSMGIKPLLLLSPGSGFGFRFGTQGVAPASTGGTDPRSVVREQIFLLRLRACTAHLFRHSQTGTWHLVAV